MGEAGLTVQQLGDLSTETGDKSGDKFRHAPVTAPLCENIAGGTGAMVHRQAGALFVWNVVSTGCRGVAKTGS